MSQFAFSTDAESEQYCHEIVAALIDGCGASEQEALERINILWAGFPFLGMDLRYHDMPEVLAKNLFYGKEQFWWLDERGLQSQPLEPAKTLGISISSHPTTLLNALDHPEAEVRTWAAHILGYKKDEDSDDLVNHRLSHTLRHDVHARVRYWAAYALGVRSYTYFTPIISSALYAALKDPECGVRAQAAIGLGNHKEAMSVAPLLEALHDVEGCVRWRAVQTLGYLGEISAVTALIPVLQDRDPLVQRAVLWALERLGDKQAIGPLIDLLEFIEEQQRLPFELALTKLGSASTILFPLLAHLSSSNKVTRHVVVRVLGSLKDERALPPLIHTLQNEPIIEIRTEAALSLIMIGDVGVLDALLSWANEEDDQIHNWIIDMLLQQWSKKISPEVKKHISAMRVTQKQRRTKKRRGF